MNPRFDAVKGKIIDFRLRPPTGPYRAFFTEAVVDRLCRMWGDDGPPPSFATGLHGMGDSDDEALAVLTREMDSAGVRLGVMNGRHSPNRAVPVKVSDVYLHALARRMEGRLLGIAGVDLSLAVDEIVAGIDTAVTQLGMRGVCVEPGFAPTPLYADDESLMPVYQKVSDLGVPLLFMSGPLAGPDLGYTDPVRFERVARRFPNMPIVLGHGAYPYVHEAVALAYKSEATGAMNVHLSPDVYMFAPGAAAYVEAVNLMPERMIFGSAYAFCSIGTAVARTMALPISDDVLGRYMYRNAGRLLGFEANAA